MAATAATGAPPPPGGTLDPSFNGTGTVTTSFGTGNSSFADGVRVQDNGKTVAVGGTLPPAGNGVFAIARYNKNGSLDQSFGTNGQVTTDFGTGGDSLAAAVAFQDNGKILVVGYASDAANHFQWALARYRQNGTLDPSFGSGGRVLTSFGGGYDFADAVTLADDGKIVVAGEASPDGSTKDFGVARYNNNGSLDTSFNGTGMVTTDFGHGFASANGVALKGNKIIAAGYASNGTDKDAVLAAYRSNGALDPTFGTGGTTTVDFGPGDDAAHAIDIKGDRIVIAGSATNGSTNDFAVAALDKKGQLDTSFAGTGKTTIDFGADDTAYGVGIDSRNRIVAGGDTFSATDQFAVARLRPNGTPDSSFGTGGKVTTSFGQDAGAFALDVQQDDRIVLAGYAGEDFALARYLSGERPADGDDGHQGGGGNEGGHGHGHGDARRDWQRGH